MSKKCIRLTKFEKEWYKHCYKPSKRKGIDVTKPFAYESWIKVQPGWHHLVVGIDPPAGTANITLDGMQIIKRIKDGSFRKV